MNPAPTPPAFDLAEVDPSGALADTLHEAGGLTRSAALRAAAAGFGGAALAGVIGTGSAQAATISKKNDLKILAFALVAEQLGAAFYEEAIKAGKLSGATLSYAKQARTDERAHVKAVSGQIRKLGGKPAPAPDFDFKGTTRRQTSFQTTAAMIEELCVETLNGAGPLVTESTLKAAGGLVSVEARQVTWIRLIIGDQSTNPVPSAYDTARSLASAKRKVKATGFVKS